MNSGPLSDRMWAGTPRRMKRSDNSSMTSTALSRRAMRIARHSWVNSSTIFEHAILSSVMGAVLEKVIGPDVVAALRPQPDAGAVRQPEPPAFGLFAGNLEPLTPPDTLDPLVVDQPAGPAQQRCDLAIAVGPYCLASSTISAVSRSSSSRPPGTFRWVERYCPSAAQARRSDTASTDRT